MREYAAIGYQETIRKRSPSAAATRSNLAATASISDVVLEISPSPRSNGFDFHDKIVGGVVPKQ